MSQEKSPKTYGLLCLAAASKSKDNKSKFPEIHINIWERENKKNSKNSNSYLDIGFMLDINDPTPSIALIFPASIPIKDIVDLSEVVSSPAAIPLIFNETWAVSSMSSQGTDSIVHDPNDKNMSFAIVNTNGAIEEKEYYGYKGLSIDMQKIITKGKSIATNLQKEIGRVYFRFRILEIKKSFYCVGAAEHNEDWWMPIWQRTEDIDFRLNVRRGAPSGLESSIGHFIEFSKVHLFLMRSRDKDIVFQDKLFNSSRSLEDEEFWAKYSFTGNTGGDEIEASRKRVTNSLGYHWKAKQTSEVPVKEFAILARFKIVEFGIGKFLLVALLLGAAGSALWDGAKKILDMSCSNVTSKVSENSLEIQARAPSLATLSDIPSGNPLEIPKETK